MGWSARDPGALRPKSRADDGHAAFIEAVAFA